MTAMPQHIVALEHANEVRLGRAALRERVAQLPRPAGCLRVAEMLEDPPELIETMAIADLLLWIHRYGKSQTRSVLMHADEFGPIGEKKRVGDLSERQRYALADHLYEAYRAARRGS